MIKVKSITIEEFRGIRSLTIDFNEKNYAVCGPNGTGKSGIVDAIEFSLTGNISRLSGEGMGNVTVRDHAPHVDSRNRPDKAKVILVASIPHLRKEVRIERTVKDATNPVITPNTSDVLEVLEKIALHPEFVLSRRQLIRYVISTPGNRAKAVQTLLRLDDIENLRATFLKISNTKQREVAPLLREKNRTKDQLLSALQITDFSKEKILAAVNIRRALLSLPVLTDLTPTNSIRDGLAVTPATPATKIPKAQTLADLKKLKETIDGISSAAVVSDATSLIAELEVLNNNPDMVNSVSKEQFLRTSLTLIENDNCPLCDKEWSIDELKAVVQAKLKKFEEVTKTRKDLERKVVPLVSSLEDLNNGLSVIVRCGPLLVPPINIDVIKDFKIALEANRKQLNSFVPLGATIEILKKFSDVPKLVVDTISAIEAAVIALPEASEQDTARDYLTIGQERLDQYRHISLQHKKSEEEAALTKQISETYNTVSNSVLEGVYKKVEQNFSELYRDINQDNESKFSAQLVPESGKLDLDVDFFGRGFFPPGAYHSEGHQDGMGICLYLALMRHLLGEGFSFAVMDDVLMSVDAGHRREVCSMIKKYFPDTQFIFTTHDGIWLEHMKNSGLVARSSAIHFRTWDVDNGPKIWDDRDVWKQIKDEVATNDIRSAAGLLRHYLEHISAELCHRLGARVQFRADARFELGDLLPSVIGRFKNILKEGKATAQSWGKTAEFDAITAREKAFDELVEESNVEKWMINAAVHHNQWDNLQAADFSPVVDVYEKLMASFVCSNSSCASVLYILPERGGAETLRCACGGVNINLVRKPPEPNSK